VYIIVGLGNPDAKYEKTRHNAGFEVIDKLANTYGIDFNKKKFKAIIGEGMIGSEKVILVKPTTYMNLSGESVEGAIGFYKLTSENIIVIYDDISLDVGKIRIRERGSAGGHNGIKSIVSCIKTENFKRIRIGIGKKPEEWDLADYVLSQFNKDEEEIIITATTTACEAIETIVRDGIGNAMNRFN